MVIRTFFLPKDNAGNAEHVAHNLCEYLAGMIRSNKKTRIRVDQGSNRRNDEQNALFHALCGEIAKQRQWAGKERDTEAWKRLLVDAYSRSEGHSQCEVVPSLDGSSVVMLGIQTRSMSVAQMAELITWCQSWCWHEGVELSQ